MGSRGPLPKPDAARRRKNPLPPELQLPAAGRMAPAPEWPVGVTSRKPAGALLSIWEDLWKRPQAVAWEGLHLDLTVARYARLLQLSLKADATKSFAGEVRQLEDRLGLNGPSMQRLRWVIVQPERREGDEQGEGTVANLDDYRNQFGG